ncbi:MAG TPA: FAD-linked oxidase C-terminal domain-containing protein [Pyrinomonadaceae bacterium]
MNTLIEDLRAVVGPNEVLADPEELLVYECDGLPHHKHLPRAVVFPNSTESTAEVMRVLARHDVPYTPRGAGTGLSGGALAINNGVVIEMARMRKVLRIDHENLTATVQTGVVNLQVSRAVAQLGLHYIPDPSSQPTCTIGGNISENAGGIHCLKYGTTTDHVLSARVVLPGGKVVDLSSAETGSPGYDLLGVFIGSEGTFGVATEATLRLVPIPPAVRTLLAEFAEVNDASHAVSAIIAAGVMPAALEMMDREIIRAIEASIFAAGLPPDAGAALLIELDGVDAGLDDEAEKVKAICLHFGASNCRLARDENERKKLWAARKGAFGAVGRIAPDSMIQDAVVPRSRLPQVMEESYRIAAKYGLILANVFHAGDGNLHPLICFDSRSLDEVRRVKEAGRELMEVCVRAGGSITGEHGVGLDKRDYLPLIFSPDDMETMLNVRAAFDPTGLCNPGKIIPTLRGCGEGRAVASLPGKENGNGPAQPLAPSRPLKSSRAVESAAVLPSVNVSVEDVPKGDTLTPGSIAELTEIMNFVSRERLQVVPEGAGTWRNVGNPISRIDLTIKTDRLNRIIDHEPADLIATAEAGVTLKEFNDHLSLNGQWLPLDPPDDGTATLGGVIATGLAGAQSYGPPRRHVIGMQVVLANGKVVNAGGRVVKNVAGYDLCKLFTGSYGTLGLITQLRFKLRPLPQSSVSLITRGPIDSLLAAAQAITAARLFDVAIELLSSRFAVELELNEGNDCLLLVRFSGSSKTVERQTRAAAALLRPFGEIIQVDVDDGAVWRKVAALPLQLPERPMWRVSLPPAAVAGFVRILEATHSNAASRAWQASMATGRIRMIEPAGLESAELEQSLSYLRGQARSLGGWLLIENADAGVKKTFDAWGDFGAQRDLMKRVKKAIDPNHLFSPGRL